MKDIEQFYPTPKELIDELLAPVDEQYVYTVLEPSAGNGDLLEGLKSRRFEYYDPKIYCIEVNKTRQNTLKGKEYSVIWDDFMTFDSMMRFSFILMNPPFVNGDMHLLKAIDLCENGGQIACILNAETIKNPYTETRKKLAKVLDEQEKVTIRYKTGAFAGADRKTNVEVALIYIKKKVQPSICHTFEFYKKSVVEERKIKEQDSVTRYGESDQRVDIYKVEVKTALRLYDELEGYRNIALKSKLSYSNNLFEVKIDHISSEEDGDRLEYADRLNIVRSINYKYWGDLLYSREFSKLLTGDLQNRYLKELRKMADLEFNDQNIAQLKIDLFKNLSSGIDDAIMKVWDDFTRHFAWSEYSKNVHFYDGWATNNAFRCNKKVIIPLYAYSSWDKNQIRTYQVQQELSDIEKAMNYLDCGRTESFDLAAQLKRVEETGEARNIDTKFFIISMYKKGTCHLIFKDMELLKKFNLYAGKKLNFLPGDYGKKSYTDLSDRERKIVDDFEGKDSYSDTYANQDFYLPTTQNLLLLK